MGAGVIRQIEPSVIVAPDILWRIIDIVVVYKQIIAGTCQLSEFRIDDPFKRSVLRRQGKGLIWLDCTSLELT